MATHVEVDHAQLDLKLHESELSLKWDPPALRALVRATYAVAFAVLILAAVVAFV